MAPKNAPQQPARVLPIKIENEAGQVIALLAATAMTFKTGSRGFNATGRIVIDGKPYQAGVNLVEIGTKPTK